MATMASSGAAKVTLPTDTSIVISREFDAPKDLVFRAWTTPELVKRWWVGNRGVATLAEIDLRVGGTWRYVMVTHGGLEVAFHGSYLEIVTNERIVSTEVFEGLPDAQSLNTLTLTEAAGRTTFEILVQYATREGRDTHLGYGMEGGMQEALDALDEVARSLA
ncbi:SRPBCC family protein [soil metagenome]